MKYRDKVINYFDFSSGINIQKSNKTQKAIGISGTIKKNTIIFYIVFVLFFSVVSFIFAIQISAFSDFDSIENSGLDTFFSNIKVQLLLPLVITMVAPIIMVIVIFIKNKILFNRMEPKPKNINIYQRELPSKLKPAHVRMLLTDGLIDSTSVAATLLDLVDRGYIALSKNRTKLDIFQNEEIILTKTNKNQDELLKYEKFLITWFIDICGDGNKVSNIEIKESLANSQANNKPSELFEQFQALVMISFPINKYYQKNKTNEKKNLIYVMVLFASFILIPFYIGALLCAWSLGNLMFNSPKYKMNQDGVDEKDSWLDLKSFLIDFSNIKDQTSEMIVIWEYYLTYSIVLNIDSHASYEMQNFFGKEIYNNDGTPLNAERYENIEGGLANLKEIQQKLNEQINRDNIEIEKDVKQELELYERIMK